MSDLAFNVFWRDRGAQRGMDKLADTADRVSKRSSGLGRAVKAGAAIAGVALLKFGSDSVHAYTDSLEAQTRLEDAFARFPKLAFSNIEALRKMNTELAKKTRFDDDAFASGQAVLAGFKLSGHEIMMLTPLLADYAVKTGKDLPSAAATLGKSFLGNTRALKELGINYKATGDRAKDQAAITELLRQKVGGLAEKQGQTVDKSKILANQFGELQETAGSKLLPVLLKLTDAGLKTIDWIQRNSDVLGPLAAIVGTFAGTLFTVVKAVGFLNVALRAMGVSTTIALGPIGLIIAAIAAVAVGLVIAYKKSETFRDIVKGVFKVIGLAVLTYVAIALRGFRFVINAWLTLVGALVHGAAKAFGWIPGLGPKLKTADKEFTKFKNSVVGSLDKTITKVDDLRDKLRGIKSKNVTIDVRVTGAVGTALALGSVGSPAGRASNFDRGGTLRPGLNLVHNATGRPERLVPAGEGGITVVINGAVGDPAAIARMVHGELINLQSRGHRLGFTT